MSARPKGYMDSWDPQPAAALLIHQTNEVLNEYRSYGPMTVRQIFYRLVGNYDYDKTERAYKRLAEVLVKARRAQLVRFGDIRDSGTESAGGGGYDDRAQFWRGVRYSADSFELDRQLEQPQEIELWCEAAGMVPMLAGMVSEWSIPVYSTGGFSSVTVTYETAQRVLSRPKPTAFLHIGDFDPSGESIFESMSQDIGAFVVGRHGGKWNRQTGETHQLANGAECHFKPRRVALTADQVEEYDLPTAPPKTSDSRSAKWIGETTQAEALPPSLLEEIVREAVSELIDTDTLEEVLAREEDDRAEINRVLEIAEEEE